MNAQEALSLSIQNNGQYEKRQKDILEQIKHAAQKGERSVVISRSENGYLHERKWLESLGYRYFEKVELGNFQWKTLRYDHVHLAEVSW